MKRGVLIFGLSFIILTSCGTATKNSSSLKTDVKQESYVKATFPISEAKRIIRSYAKNMHSVSYINVYEGKKYYIGEVYLKGYKGFDTIRKIYLSKTDKSIILPTMAETYDYRYMQEK